VQPPEKVNHNATKAEERATAAISDHAQPDPDERFCAKYRVITSLEYVKNETPLFRLKTV
jgi:hypothetical protein